MPLLEWNDQYSVGIDEFDAQHKKMFSLINRLFDMMKSGKDKAGLPGVLAELVAYGSTHLANEEKYFDEYDYPGGAAHKLEHDAYRKKIVSFTDRKDDAFVSFDMIDYLEDWWLSHITGVDKQYTDFFHSKGLK